jgi:ribosomal protein L40E
LIHHFSKHAICSKCGKYSTQIPCPYCGFNPTAPSQTQTTKTCASCGTANPGEAQWCINCNKSLY